MPAYSVFALGSGESYDSKSTEPQYRTINTSFYDACQGDKLLLQGPSRLGGAYDPQTIRENVTLAAKQFKEWLATQPRPTNGEPYNLNLSGFSRGSITCLKIANEIQRMVLAGELSDQNGPLTLNHIAVNLSIDDPVSGITDKSDPTTRTIPRIVKHCAIPLQRDDRRRFFMPQDLSRLLIEDHASTQLTMLPFYGEHTYSTYASSEETLDGPMINWNLKYRFMQSHGSNFSGIPPIVKLAGTSISEEACRNASRVLTDNELLESFARTMQNRNSYAQTARGFQAVDSLAGGRARSFNQHLEDYVTDPFFLNQYMRELFKRCYPKAFNYLFEQATFDPNNPQNTGGFNHPNGGYTQAQLQAELQQMYTNNNQLFVRLENQRRVYRSPETSQISLIGPPGGIHRIERCHFTNALNNQPSSLTPLDLLEKQIVQATYQYERDKSPGVGTSRTSRVASEIYMSFAERSEAERARQIRQELRAILAEPGDDDTKHKKMLSTLKLHIIELRQIGSNSKLIASLENIVNQHQPDQILQVETSKKFWNRMGERIGTGIKRIGQGLQRFGRAVGVPIAAAGEAVRAFGERTVEMSTNSPYWFANPFRVGAAIIGSFIQLGGWIAKNVGKRIEKPGSALKRAGEKTIQASGYYSVREVPRENTIASSVIPIPTPSSTSSAIQSLHIDQSAVRQQLQKSAPSESKQMPESPSPQPVVSTSSVLPPPTKEPEVTVSTSRRFGG